MVTWKQSTFTIFLFRRPKICNRSHWATIRVRARPHCSLRALRENPFAWFCYPLEAAHTSRASSGSVASWDTFWAYVDFHNFCFLNHHDERSRNMWECLGTGIWTNSSYGWLVRPPRLGCPLVEEVEKGKSGCCPLMNGMVLLPFITLWVCVMGSRNKLEGNCTALTEKRSNRVWNNQLSTKWKWSWCFLKAYIMSDTTLSTLYHVVVTRTNWGSYCFFF